MVLVGRRRRQPGYGPIDRGGAWLAGAAWGAGLAAARGRRGRDPARGAHDRVRVQNAPTAILISSSNWYGRSAGTLSAAGQRWPVATSRWMSRVGGVTSSLRVVHFVDVALCGFAAEADMEGGSCRDRRRTRYA